MANSRTHILITDETNWTLVEVDPDLDGYVNLIVNPLIAGKVEWSTEETVERTSRLPDGDSIFNYNIYLRKIKDGADVNVALTRV